MPEQRGRGMAVERPVCADPATRRAALNVLASAARKSPKAMSVLLDNVSGGRGGWGGWGKSGSVYELAQLLRQSG